MLITDDTVVPVANNDTATTNEAQPTVVNILDNDSADTTIDLSTIQLGTNPANGKVTLNNNGTTTYTPNSNFVGTDYFTYLVQDALGTLSNEATVTVTVNNVAPAIDNIIVEPNITEGAIATLSATATDPGNNLTYTWNFGDGSNSVAGQTVNHIWADNGTYTASLTVTDTYGASTVETLLLNVNNLAPNVSAGADIITDEDTAITFNGNFTDSGINDTHTIEWDFGDGTTTTGILNPTHTYTKDGLYTAILTVTDNDGGTSNNSLTVTVNNIDPIINSISADTTINEGATANFTATATTPSDETLIYTWNFGDDTDPQLGQTVNHIFAKDGNYTVTLTVTDTSNGIATETLTVQVNNAAPIITNVSGDTNINEGAIANFTATAKDPGNDAIAYTWDFGNGITKTGENVSYVFADEGTYEVILTATDTDSATTQETLTVTVNNVAPIVDAGADLTTDEGSAVTFNGNFTDPGIQDTHTINWDFGDGTTAESTLNPNHIFINNGVYYVKLKVLDNDGGESESTLTVRVDNVAPTITNVAGEININEGATATFSATATDKGNDTLTYTWNFGDETDPVVGQNVNHLWADNGIYNVTLTVSDNDGASTSSTLSVNVNNVAPTVAAGDHQIMYVGETVAFNGHFTDPGIKDTHAIAWDFGDGNIVKNDLNPTHIYAVDGTYNVTLTVTDKDGAVATDAMTVTVFKLPTLSVSDISLSEGDDGNTFTVFTASLSEPSLRTVTANYFTTDGTAISGKDYTISNGTITFAPGETSQTIIIPIIGDRIDEDDETFSIKLRDVTNATIVNTTASATIVDNDQPPTLFIADKIITEEDSTTATVTYTVNLSATSAKSISVKYATVDGTAIAGTDYIATNGIITFAPGETTKFITVQVLGDTIDEFDETFFLNLSDATNATITSAFSVSAIADNDEAPVLTIADRTITEGDTGTMAVTYTINLTASSGKPITVDYTTADHTATSGKDYIATSGKLTFAPGETTKTITVQTLGDAIDEFDEDFFLNLTNATNVTIVDNQAVTTIIDNDAPPLITIGDKTITEGHNGTFLLNFTVSLNTASEKQISVKYQTANGTAIAGSDYTATTGIVTFAPGEITKIVSVPIIGDRLDEQNENFFVNLNQAINANIVDSQAVGTIVDDDFSPIIKVQTIPGELWPPNHKMVEIKVNITASDDFDVAPIVKLVSITSNEPDNGLGDGDTPSDIQILSDGRIFLRAERSGSGTGRVYTLTYSATDSAGNVTYTTALVKVPHSKGN